MVKKILIIWAGLIIGVFFGILVTQKWNLFKIPTVNFVLPNTIVKHQKVVLGFLPFWLIDKTADDYSSYINQLSYFNLTIDGDGTIQKYTSPGESDPGYHALFTGKIDDFLAKEKSKGIELSLTVFSGNDKKIDKFLEDPNQSAQNLVNEITPFITQYGFSDINLDIEKVSDASPSAREKYSNFVSLVKNNLDKNITVTVDCPPIAFVKDKNLCDPKSLSQIADYIVLMDYDFHNPGSFVTGPVSPQSGAGIVSEFDTESAVQAALINIDSKKLILAIPLYGYSWETVNPGSRSAVLPGSAFSISSRGVNDLLNKCASCSSQFDTTDQESYFVYKDTETGTYHQVFYPDKTSTQTKVNFANSKNLGGIALWALGYEDSTILNPLTNYLSR